MDQDRFEELKRKRFEGGLTDEEADELGRMFAEEQGKPYENAGGRPHPEETPEARKAEDHGVRVKRMEESGEAPDVDTTTGPQDDHRPEEERAVGTARQPVAPAGGYLPPKGGTEAAP